VPYRAAEFAGEGESRNDLLLESDHTVTVDVLLVDAVCQYISTSQTRFQPTCSPHAFPDSRSSAWSHQNLSDLSFVLHRDFSRSTSMTHGCNLRITKAKSWETDHAFSICESLKDNDRSFVSKPKVEEDEEPLNSESESEMDANRETYDHRRSKLLILIQLLM
jgi:hypothetical protein